MQLRPYQLAARNALWAYLTSRTGNPLVVLPTGTGKSVCIADFCRSVLDKYSARILIVTHVKELVQQNYEKMLAVWPEAPAGIYSAGLGQRDTTSPLLFCGIQSVYDKAYDIQKVSLVIIDEVHLVGGNDGSMYRRFFNDIATINGKCRVVGYTATPYRLDSGHLTKSPNALFDDVVYNYSMLQAMNDGYLCRLSAKATPTILDTDGVARRGGEFVSSELQKAVDTDDLNGMICDDIVAAGSDRKSWLVFCSGVEHAYHIRDRLRDRGVTAETVVADTDNRADIFDRFKRGEIRALTGMNVFTTGFDAPNVDLIAMLRPTLSPGLVVQMAGRGTRISPSKSDCLILDFARNIRRHGPIDMIGIETGKEKGEGGDAPIKMCPQCAEIVYAGVAVCPICTFVFPPPVKELTSKAYDDAVLSDEIIEREVYTVSYARHEKEGKRPSMKVTYETGLTSHSEWICFEHEGFARAKAVKWWGKRADGIAPRSVAEALERTSELAEPERIRVQRDGKYWRVL